MVAFSSEFQNEKAAAGLAAATEAFKKIGIAAREACEVIASALAPIVRAVQDAVRCLSANLYLWAERVYLQHHRRLPASNRTSRLRKKRAAIVMDFFSTWLSDNLS